MATKVVAELVNNSPGGHTRMQAMVLVLELELHRSEIVISKL